MKKKLKTNGQIILSACGDDTAFYEYQNELKFSAYLTNGANFIPKINSKSYKKIFGKVLTKVDKIVPSDFCYYKTMSCYLKDNKIEAFLSKPFYLPFEIPDFGLSYPEKRIKILYGIPKARNKKRMKGANHILEALEIIKRKYQNRIEVLLPEGLPYDEYVNELKKSDIVVDQAYAYGLGINAVMAMSYGKVVLGGNEQENRDLFGIDYMPVINIVPDPEQIAKELEKLILNPERIIQLSKESRAFAMRHFSSEIIAQKYIDLLNQ